MNKELLNTTVEITKKDLLLLLQHLTAVIDASIDAAIKNKKNIGIHIEYKGSQYKLRHLREAKEIIEKYIEKNNVKLDKDLESLDALEAVLRFDDVMVDWNEKHQISMDFDVWEAAINISSTSEK